MITLPLQGPGKVGAPAEGRSIAASYSPWGALDAQHGCGECKQILVLAAGWARGTLLLAVRPQLPVIFPHAFYVVVTADGSRQPQAFPQ